MQSVSARGVSTIVNAQAESVSRATFMAWTLDALGIDRTNTSCTVPYERFPVAQRGTLCAAQTYDLLRFFRPLQRYTLGKAVTRGEALVIVTSILRVQQEAPTVHFDDVVGVALQRAVGQAIAKDWMQPRSADVFGVQEPLTGADALRLLLRAAGDDGSTALAPSQEKKESVGFPKQQLLSTIWDILKKEYLHADAIKDDEAAYRAIEALVDSLGDPYTTFYRPEQAENFALQIKGAVDGIGAQVESKDGVVIVIAPLPGSPAERVGIMSGDHIIEADGVSLVGLTLDRAVQHIRGPRGSTVHLVIERSGMRLELSVVRQSISIPELDVQWHDRIAVITLLQFGDATDTKFRSLLSEVASRMPRGIVIDLRNNGGGLLHAAGVVMSAFVPQDTVFAKVENPSETQLQRTEEAPVISPDTKIVVVVNKGSASASEIVAGAMQDLRRGTVIGSQTFGKGTVQHILSFPDGEALKLTSSEWHTPLGRSINGVGITPDIVVNSDDRDEQMRRALDLLR